MDKSQPDVASSPRRLPSAERQAGIVAAVVEMAALNGPSAITTQAIADRLGVTHGALFRHFPDKQSIWNAVFDWLEASLGAVLGDAFHQGGDPLETLGRVFFAHVAFVAAHPGVPRILFNELQGASESPSRQRLRLLVGGYRERLAELFAAAKRSGQLPTTLDAEAAAALFLGTLQGLALQSALFVGERSLADSARRLYPLLLAGFRGAGGTVGGAD
jgi:AcrR family transcriptional regulator